MGESCDTHPDSQLQFLPELLEEGASIDGDVFEIAEDTWMVHGVAGHDGEMPMAVFDTYDEAKRVLDQALGRRGSDHGGTSAPLERSRPLEPRASPRAHVVRRRSPRNPAKSDKTRCGDAVIALLGCALRETPQPAGPSKLFVGPGPLLASTVRDRRGASNCCRKPGRYECSQKAAPIAARLPPPPRAIAASTP
jgi:hypothetical protein